MYLVDSLKHLGIHLVVIKQIKKVLYFQSIIRQNLILNKEENQMLFIVLEIMEFYLVVVLLIVLGLLTTAILIQITMLMQVMHMKMHQMDKTLRHFYQDNITSLLLN
jgi:hypothetical protein